MPDPEIPFTPVEGGPEGGAEGAVGGEHGGSQPGLAYAVRPVYKLIWIGEATYFVGADVAVGWELTRHDGGAVELPRSGTLEIKDTAGAILTAPALYRDQTTAAVKITLTAMLAFTQLGAFDLKISLVMGEEGQDVILVTRVVVT